MSTISVSDLEKKSAKEWLKDVKQDVIITSDGKAVAVVLGVANGSVASAQAFVRSLRSLQAQADLQKASLKNGTSDLSMEDIVSEIAEARRIRKK